jgi:hypothetical protein
VLTDVGTQVTSVAASIGDAFSTSFKGVISGSMSLPEKRLGGCASERVADQAA